MCGKTLYWIRHGESLSNISEYNYSIIDPGLTSNGITQCKTLKTYIDSNKIIDDIDLIVVSPLNRTLETCANIIESKRNLDIEIISLDEIREHINQPCHKRKSMKEKKKKYKFVNFKKILDKDEDLIYKKFNGQEPKTNVIARCEWFVSWLKKRKEKNIMIITHGNFLFPMFLNVLTDVDNKNFFSNCEIRKNILI
jgi:broad specificity phosphatase PhoE